MKIAILFVTFTNVNKAQAFNETPLRILFCSFARHFSTTEPARPSCLLCSISETRSRTVHPLRRHSERLVAAAGKLGAWLYPLLLSVIVIQVFMRYGLSNNSIALQELQWHLYAAGFCLGLGWAYQVDAHVRISVFSERFTERSRNLIELLGLVFFMIPFSAVLTWHAWSFFHKSWRIEEGSVMPSGLPARYVIKLVLFLSLALLLFQCIVAAIRLVRSLTGGRRPDSSDGKAKHGT